MKILELRAENVKKLQVVEIKPTGAMVPITGENGSGKSSVLDSIYWALAGKKNIQAVPIHEGQDEARIRLNMGDIRVIRKFRKSGTTELVVLNAAGNPNAPDEKLDPKRSPQEFLDAMLGELSFDPLKFIRMDAREQYESIRRIVKLDVDIDLLNSQNDADFRKRAELNKEAKQLRAKIQYPPAGTPDQPIDESAIVDAISNAGIHNGMIETDKVRRQGMHDKLARLNAVKPEIESRLRRIIDDSTDKITRLEQEIETLRSNLTEAKNNCATEITNAQAAVKSMEGQISALPTLADPVNDTAIRQQLHAAKATNKLVDQRKLAKAMETEAAEVEKQAGTLTVAMKAREKQKQDAIAKADMPIAGLSFGDGFMMFGKLPLDQASDAEQLRVSAGIAMSGNPTIRVMRIKDGSLLDKKSMALLEQLAIERDFQIWIECVGDQGETSIIMEDGAVKVHGRTAPTESQNEPGLFSEGAR